MGNRVYVTIKSEKSTETIYCHWNGGLDTWCPLVHYAFTAGYKTPEDVVGALTALGVRAEVQTSPDARNYMEENGHYVLDLSKKEFIVRTEKATYPVAPEHLELEFEDYLSKKIRPECHDEVRKTYWIGIPEHLQKTAK